MSGTTLPEGWLEERDSQGGVYYVNHAGRITTRERPTRPAAKLPPPSYVPAGSKSMDPKNFVCTPRLIFWSTAGISWVVWMFAISAASDDKWLEDMSFNDGEFAVASDYWLRVCDKIGDRDTGDATETISGYTFYTAVDSATNLLNGFDDDWGDDFCNLYKAFSGMQIIATILCSAAVVVLTLAFFRPAIGGCCSVLLLGRVGAVLMLSFALFQLLACLIAVVIEKQEADPLNSSYGVDEGDTFAVAVVGCALGLVSAVLLCMYASRSGDGPFHKGASADTTHNAQGGHPKERVMTPAVP